MDQPFAVDGYVLTDLVGFGATGEVWRGRDETTHEPVALKRLWEPAAEGLVLRLRQDAAVVGETAGSHAVPVLEVATLPGGEVVLVMAYAEGGSLASLLTRRGRLHPSEVVTVLGPLADALAALHARGIVHGDLTPANVLFTADGCPMLGDVGLAVVTGEKPGDDVGFRDPALDASTPPTAASDCFALAAIGYAALTGVPPRAASRPEVIEPIVGRAPWVPARLAAAIEAALAPDPATRPDVAGFGAAVLSACGAAPVRLTGPRRTPDPAPAATEVVMPRNRKPRGGILTGMVAAVVGIAALVGIASARLDPPHASALQPGPTATDGVSDDPTASPRWTDGTPYRPIVAHLLALRAHAFATGRLKVLRSVYTPTSLVMDMDTGSLRVMRSQQLRTRGFTQRITAMTTEDVSGGWVELAVTTAIPAYSVVDRSGRVVARRAGRTQRFDLDLVRRHGVWLISGLAVKPFIDQQH